MTRFTLLQDEHEDEVQELKNQLEGTNRLVNELQMALSQSSWEKEQAELMQTLRVTDEKVGIAGISP